MSEAKLGQSFHTLVFDTSGPGLTDITADVGNWLTDIAASDGSLTIFNRHTSASLLIQENADPDVHLDLINALSRIAPRDLRYIHSTEGPDDMPAHIKAAVTQTSLCIPVKEGRMVLGTWQGIYLFEHRDLPHRREIVLHYLGT